MGQRRRAPWLGLLFLAAGALLLRLALAEEELQAATSAVATPNGGVEECEDEVVLKKGENAVRGDVDDVKRHTSLRGWGVWSGRGRGRGIGGGIGRGNGQNGDRGINSDGRGKIKGSNGGNRNVIGGGNKGGGGDGGSDNAQSGDGGGGWESSDGGGGRGDVSGAGGGGGGGGDDANGVRQFIVPGPSICSSHRCKHGGDGTGNGQRKITTTGGNHGSSGVTKPKGEP